MRMGRGKAAAQAAHASCEAVFLVLRSGNEVWLRWLEEWRARGQPKIVLRVDSVRELGEIYSAAVDEGLPSSFIRDAGRTQLEPGTPTAVAVGPAPSSRVDKITGRLKLY